MSENPTSQAEEQVQAAAQSQAPARTETQAQAEHELPEAAIALGSPWQPAITGWIALGLLFAFAALGLRRLKKLPSGLQNAWEFTYEWVEDISRQAMGPGGPALMPYFFSVFMFILFSNLLGLVPYMASPTAKTSTTAALALCTFLSTHVLGMRRKGVLGYWGHFFHILDYRQESGLGRYLTFFLQFFLLPLIELVGELARPLSLTMRLFGNIFAKEMLLAILAYLVLKYFEAGTPKDWALMAMPLALRPAVLVLGVLVSLIQAVVFTVLSMIYIGGAIAVHEEHEDHAAGHTAHA